MKKIFLCALVISFFSAGIVVGQKSQTASATVEMTDDNDDELLAEASGDEGDEIGNYDFLYNDGESFNYDEILVENLMEEAMSHLGARYRFGSKGPYTFDCSGFTSYVYRQQGTGNIGASSRDQYARNIPIKRNELQPGDLVFFTSPRSGRGVGHVGIVVGVDPVTHNFEFIHASTSQGVKISKSTESAYSRRYVGARRVQ